MSRPLKRAVVSAVLVACLWTSVSWAQGLETVRGPAKIVDGDTLDVAGTRVRLNGIDAPERGSLCAGIDVYQRSAESLRNLVSGQTVTCTPVDTDRYGRTVATCAVGAVDLGAAQTKAGWARDWPLYSDGRHAKLEREARSRRAGIWAAECPEIWGDRRY